jgi:hypothetical protein
MVLGIVCSEWIINWLICESVAVKNGGAPKPLSQLEERKISRTGKEQKF